MWFWWAPIRFWKTDPADGTVEAMEQGESANVETITRWARHGPELARVERVDTETVEGAYTNFTIIAPD